jgi:hypothetical protein
MGPALPAVKRRCLGAAVLRPRQQVSYCSRERVQTLQWDACRTVHATPACATLHEQHPQPKQTPQSSTDRPGPTDHAESVARPAVIQMRPLRPVSGYPVRAIDRSKVVARGSAGSSPRGSSNSGGASSAEASGGGAVVIAASALREVSPAVAATAARSVKDTIRAILRPHSAAAAAAARGGAPAGAQPPRRPANGSAAASSGISPKIAAAHAQLAAQAPPAHANASAPKPRSARGRDLAAIEGVHRHASNPLFEPSSPKAMPSGDLSMYLSWPSGAGGSSGGGRASSAGGGARRRPRGASPSLAGRQAAVAPSAAEAREPAAPELPQLQQDAAPSHPHVAHSECQTEAAGPAAGSVDAAVSACIALADAVTETIRPALCIDSETSPRESEAPASEAAAPEAAAPAAGCEAVPEEVAALCSLADLARAIAAHAEALGNGSSIGSSEADTADIRAAVQAMLGFGERALVKMQTAATAAVVAAASRQASRQASRAASVDDDLSAEEREVAAVEAEVEQTLGVLEEVLALTRRASVTACAEAGAEAAFVAAPLRQGRRSPAALRRASSGAERRRRSLQLGAEQAVAELTKEGSGSNDDSASYEEAAPDTPKTAAVRSYADAVLSNLSTQSLHRGAERPARTRGRAAVLVGGPVVRDRWALRVQGNRASARYLEVQQQQQSRQQSKQQ